VGSKRACIRFVERAPALLRSENMTTQEPPTVPLARELELLRVVSLKEAAAVGGVSVDTLRRRRADKILQLSPRRKGMRLRDALALSAGK
jgi:hypothetical protein